MQSYNIGVSANCNALLGQVYETLYAMFTYRTVRRGGEAGGRGGQRYPISFPKGIPDMSPVLL